MKKVVIILIAVATISCVKDKGQVNVPTYPPKTIYTNILILGNSITYTPANPILGWSGSWGMAASVADSDYVHLLTVRFQALNKSAVVNVVNVTSFEVDYDNYDLDANLKTYKDLKPQLIILRIGENVQTVGLSDFEQKYVDLIKYFKSNNPNVTILAVGSIWPGHYLADKVMTKYSPYISLSKLVYNKSNFAYGLFSDPGIQIHPGDKGMKGISNLIWTAIVNLP